MRRHSILGDKAHLAMVAGGCFLAWIGQTKLDQGEAAWLGWLSLILSALCIAAIIPPLPVWRTNKGSCNLPRPTLLWCGLALCVPAWLGFAGNLVRWWALACWIVALCLAMAACWEQQPIGSRWAKANSLGRPRHLAWTQVALVVALLLGGLARFYHLEELPADLGWDLPYNYSDAQRILDGEYLVFFPDNYGREGIFFYLIAVVAKVMGLSAFSIRVTSALVGVVTVAGIYGLGRVCFDQEVGAVAAVALAVNRWHLALTRSGYRVSLMPLFAILMVTALAWALRRGRSRDWALAGLWAGLGLMTYKAFTFAAMLVLGVVAVAAVRSLWLGRGSGRSIASSLLGPALVMILLGMAALPILRVIIETPELYVAREMHGGNLVAESLAREGISRTQLYARNLLTSARMFNEIGDGNPRFGVPFQRHMGFVSAILVLWGFGIAVRQRFRGPYGLLVVSVVGLILPMTVSMLWGEPPNCFRSSGVIGPSLVLGAAALVALVRWILGACSQARAETEIRLVVSNEARRHEKVLRLRWSTLLTAALYVGSFGLGVAEAIETRHDYFVAFRQVAPDMGNYSVAKAIADRIIAYDEGPAYIKVWPYWYDGRAVQEHLGAAERSWDGEFAGLDPMQPPLRDHQGKILILMHPDDRDTFAMMRGYLSRSAYVTESYPDGVPSLLALYGER